MIVGLIIFLVGLSFSSFFSGSETGVYRVSRVRLLLDALDRSLLSRGMLWLINHPSIYVATSLIGNNIANFMVSLGIVKLVSNSIGGGTTAELLGTVVTTPVVFVFGELFPKYLFYNAPYRLLRQVRPLVILVTIAFSPISLLLGLLSRALRRLTGETPFQTRLAMQRSEIEQVLKEGHEAGLLAGGQRALALNIFETGHEPAIRYGVPIDRLPVIHTPINIATAKSEARRKASPLILVIRRAKIIGCLHFAKLELQKSISVDPIVECSQDESHLRVLLKLYEQKSDVAVLVDHAGKPVRAVTQQQLIQSFLSVSSRTSK